jgi:hypothetical protein
MSLHINNDGVDVQDKATGLMTTGEKETTMFWRQQPPASLGQLHASEDHEPSILIRRALERKERRIQQRTPAADAGHSSDDASAASPEAGPSTMPVPEDARHILRRANSLLSTAPGMPASDLSRRVAELGPIPDVLQALGPIPEVLQAFQDLLRNESAKEPDLPQHSARGGRG